MHRTPEERVAELRMLFDKLADHAAARMRRKAQEREANVRMTLQASNDECYCWQEGEAETPATFIKNATLYSFSRLS